MTLAACGGAKESPDLHEASGSFQVQLVRAQFPARQHVARTTDLVLVVKNTGDETVRQLAFTLWTGDGGVDATKAQGSFNVQTGDADQPAQTNPAWVPSPGFPKVIAGGTTLSDADTAPDGGSVAAQTDTYVFGALPAQQSRTIVWRVTPVRAGDFTLHYAVSAGLRGDAKAVTADGGPVGGTFDVSIS
jgi:hypothetical protein